VEDSCESGVAAKLVASRLVLSSIELLGCMMTT
jgi:hypothetical protein